MRSEREKFEAWLKAQPHVLNVGINNNGTYMLKEDQAAWEAWQAAKADAVPEGFVVVPKEPSKNVIDKLADVICDTFDTTIKGSENCARETYIAAIKYGVKDD